MNNSFDCGRNRRNRDRGPYPVIIDVASEARENRNYRDTVWTGERLQMTLMSIPPRGDIGEEIHPETDQCIRVESGCATVVLGGQCRGDEVTYRMGQGDCLFVPAGTRHNVINSGNRPLKLSSVYAPPEHPHGTVEATK